ncbi:hypothetical protein ABEV41_01715 [Geobacillus thermodenitrificans]|uniref:hypothetical protein n=1 Tax=Geobacillus thermodenitrificans TaxID=33940 RepID=UPI003D1F8F2B
MGKRVLSTERSTFFFLCFPTGIESAVSRISLILWKRSAWLVFAYGALAFPILFVTTCYYEETIVFRVRLVTKSRRALYFFRQTRFIGDRTIHRRCLL